jgi:hypothetical protein
MAAALIRVNLINVVLDFSIKKVAGTIRLQFNRNIQSAGRQNSPYFFCPFDNADTIAIQKILSAYINKIFFTRQTVRVNMVKGQPSFVFAHDGVGGARYRFVYTKRAGYSLGKTGFSGPQPAGQGYYCACMSVLPGAFAKRLRFFGCPGYNDMVIHTAYLINGKPYWWGSLF